VRGATRAIERQVFALMDSRGLRGFEALVPLLAGDGSFLDLAVGESEILEIGKGNGRVGLNLAAQRDWQSARRSTRKVLRAEIDRDAGDSDLDLRRHPNQRLHQRDAEFLDPEVRRLDLVGVRLRSHLKRHDD
jgi:hypothetical protein